MAQVPKLDSLFEAFARRQGIEPPLPDEEGRFEMVFDRDVPVRCFECFEMLHLVSPLATPPAPGGQRKAWLQCLMNYALKRMKDSHSTPALSEDGRLILFARFSIVHLGVEDFEARLEEHVNSLEHYRRLRGNAGPSHPVERPGRVIVRP